jgi:methylenetetrahydrofolate dehydrogenase (NADP+) / methenyltetrahydrofolate cyclohydrolase
MKQLNGKELADYIKERQAKAVRGLRQARNIQPCLAIVRTNPDPVVDSYMRIKQSYGADILVQVDVHTIEQAQALECIDMLNNNPAVHGIIVQIPLPNKQQTDQILNAVAVHKDVDGLAQNSAFDPATPMAIMWLLAGYDIELLGKNIVIVGNGRLVGKPLAKMWQSSDVPVHMVDKKTPDIAAVLQRADIVISATGVPGLITSNMLQPGVVVVDAGVATDTNGLVGDVAPDVRARDDITITPVKGGVGPLTVSALFENVITAARRSTSHEVLASNR